MLYLKSLCIAFNTFEQMFIIPILIKVKYTDGLKHLKNYSFACYL